MTEYEVLGDEIVGDGAGENRCGVGQLGRQARVDQQRRDREIRCERGRLGNLIAPVAAKPFAPAAGRSVAPRPTGVAEEILQRRQLERRSRGSERRPAEAPGQQRNRADLGGKAAETDEVEHTPPPETEPHISVCELCGKKGPREESLGGGLPCRHGADDRNVLELLRRRGGTQEHSTPAHVAPADERRGKHEPLAEYGAQHLHVLIRRDAAEQHELRIGAGRLGQTAGRLLEGGAISGISEIDLGIGKAAEHVRRDGRLGWQQTLIWGNHERAAELGRVGHFPAEVQAAHVGKQFAYRNTVAPETRGDRKRRLRREHLLSTPPPAVRGREQEHASRRHSSNFISATLRVRAGSIASPTRNNDSVANAIYPAAGCSTGCERVPRVTPSSSTYNTRFTTPSPGSDRAPSTMNFRMNAAPVMTAAAQDRHAIGKAASVLTSRTNRNTLNSRNGRPDSGVTRLKTCAAAKNVDRITTRPLRFSSGIAMRSSASRAQAPARVPARRTASSPVRARTAGGARMSRARRPSDRRAARRSKQHGQIDGFRAAFIFVS